jgi:phosphate transport system substrate-binding protein
MHPSIGKPLRSAALAALATFVTFSSASADITGAGSTFVFPVMTKWADAYKAKTGTAVNYRSVGSSAGVDQVRYSQVDFGATDKPLFPVEVNAGDMVQFPVVVGGIVPVVNLPGIAPGELVLDGPTLGAIYEGVIATWGDSAIKKLNPDKQLPNTPITVVHRSDGSGTTFNFTQYLADVKADWRDKVGVDTLVQWPVGLGADGNEGVAVTTSRTAGAIGYVEYSYALQSKLAFTRMVNHDGIAVEPSAKSFQAAVANADWQSSLSYRVVPVDQPGHDSWPMTAVSFVLIHAKYEKPDTAKELLKFFGWVFHDGRNLAENLQYVPLPDSLVAKIEATWAARVK